MSRLSHIQVIQKEDFMTENEDRDYTIIAYDKFIITDNTEVFQ